MNHRQREQAFEDLEYIKLLTLKNRHYAAEVSPYFILWGIIWVIGFGCLAMNLGDRLIWIWSTLSGVGLVINFYIVKQQEKEEPLPQFLRKQFSRIGICFLVIVAIFIILLLTGFLVASSDHLGLYSVFLVSILYLLFGVIFGKEMFYMGIWLGLISSVTAIWFMDYSAFIFAIVGGGSLIVTGFILKRWRHDHGSSTIAKNR